MRDVGVSAAIELPPAGTLTGIAKRELPGVELLAVKTPADLEAAHRLINSRPQYGQGEYTPDFQIVVTPAKGIFTRTEALSEGQHLERGTRLGIVRTNRDEHVIVTTTGGVLAEWLRRTATSSPPACRSHASPTDRRSRDHPFAVPAFPSRNTRILGLGHYQPSNVVTNADLDRARRRHRRRVDQEPGGHRRTALCRPGRDDHRHGRERQQQGAGHCRHRRRRHRPTGSLPLGKAGVGSAVNDTTRQTGGAIGIAVMGSLFAAFYHHFTSAAGKLPGNTAAAVHDSVGSALVAAAKLPAAQAAVVEHAARGAFVDAMRYTFPIGAGIVLTAAVVAWKWLPAHANDDVDLASASDDQAQAEARAKFDDFDTANA